MNSNSSLSGSLPPTLRKLFLVHDLMLFHPHLLLKSIFTTIQVAPPQTRPACKRSWLQGQGRLPPAVPCVCETPPAVSRGLLEPLDEGGQGMLGEGVEKSSWHGDKPLIYDVCGEDTEGRHDITASKGIGGHDNHVQDHAEA